jgi:(methylthio)acryloyl-CoA hydratase
LTERTAAELPATLRSERRAAIGVLSLARPDKRNALDEATVLGIGRYFGTLDPAVRAVVLTADGAHFSAGLDLADLADLDEHDALSGVQHSRMWHGAFAAIEDSPVPVLAALKGAVVGGGLELAASAHIRIADHSAFYALPEGQRGLFVGGGGSVRIPRLIGLARMVDMMLTGRRYDATEGYAVGLSQYLVDDALATAVDLAERVAANGPQTTFAVLQVLPRIVAANPGEGYMMEALVAAIAQGTEDAKLRMREFLHGAGRKVTEL